MHMSVSRDVMCDRGHLGGQRDARPETFPIPVCDQEALSHERATLTWR
jgi:hypothetical protein